MTPALEQLVALMVRNSADVLRDSAGDMSPAIMLSKTLPEVAALSVVDYRPLTDAVRMARETAQDVGKDLAGYVVAWDGYVHAGLDRTEAILMEAWEASAEKPVLLAQRYRRKPFALVGPLISVDELINF